MTQGDVNGLIQIFELAWFYFTQPIEFGEFTFSWFTLALAMLVVLLPVYVVKRISVS